jgi:hypothetical protein
MKTEQDTAQYLLDQVSRLIAENAMLKEKWLAQPEQTEQEPVAWMWTRNYEGGGYTNKVFEFLNDAEEYANDSKTLKSPDNIRPLYTAPPKHEALSDDEIVALWANKSPANEFECVRLVEKAHGIGGGE